MTITVHRVESPLDVLDELLPVYEEVYAEPPYLEGPRDVAEFVESYRYQAAGRPGACAALARVEGEVVGFGFGFLLPADTGWWQGALTPLPPELTRETGSRTFAVIELAVRKPWRRQGIARRLHDALLAGLGAERVTLTVRPEPEAEPARAAYAAWGYRTLGPTRPWDGAPLYQLMLRPLAAG